MSIQYIDGGTVTVAADATTVTGSGTSFTQLLANGSVIFIIDDVNNKVTPAMATVITSDTELTIGHAWKADPVTNGSWFGLLVSDAQAKITQASQMLLDYINSLGDPAAAIISKKLGLEDTSDDDVFQILDDGSLVVVQTSENDGTDWADAMKFVNHADTVFDTHQVMPAGTTVFPKTPYVEATGSFVNLYVVPTTKTQVTDYVGKDGFNAAVIRANQIKGMSGLDVKIRFRSGEYTWDTMTPATRPTRGVSFEAEVAPTALPAVADYVNVFATDLATFKTFFNVIMNTTGRGIDADVDNHFIVQGIGFVREDQGQECVFAKYNSTVHLIQCGTFGYGHGLLAQIGSEIKITFGYSAAHCSLNGVYAFRGSRIGGFSSASKTITVFACGSNGFIASENSNLFLYGSATAKLEAAECGGSGLIATTGSGVTYNFIDVKNSYNGVVSDILSRCIGFNLTVEGITSNVLRCVYNSGMYIANITYVSGATLAYASDYSYIRRVGTISGSITYSPALNTEGNTSSFIRST